MNQTVEQIIQDLKKNTNHPLFKDQMEIILRDEYKYRKSIIKSEMNKIKNVNVVTSGLSDSFSSGLLIGKIKEVDKETYGISNTLKITPSANFNDLKILTVIVGEK